MSDEILFLAHRLPFPPDRGDRIRSHHVLKALAAIAPVHVGCFIDSEAERAHLGQLRELAASWCVLRRARPLALAGAEAVVQRRAVSETAYASGQLSRWVRGLLASGRIAAVWVFSGQMGQFVPASWQGRLVVDLCDVDSAKFEAYAESALLPSRWLNAREGRLLRQVEARLAARADHTLLVSEEEADLLRARGASGDVRALRNGIDADGFAPEHGGATPYQGEGPHLVFTGQMDYAPNIAAVTRMAQRILPQLPQAQFHIVGRAPVAAVRALASDPRVSVHGEVPDVRPWLAHADLVVAPLTIARGVQNKVLEAMAMARPVVLSPEAATGIAARDFEHFRIASDDPQFVETCRELLTDPGELGANARAFVLAEQSWPAMLADLPDLLGLAGEGRDAA